MKNKIIMSVSNVLKIKGIGYVASGHIYHWADDADKSPQNVIFLSANCKASIQPIEIHNQSRPFEINDCNFGFVVSGLDKNNIPKAGDIMVEDS